jgi:hypothetical protein
MARKIDQKISQKFPQALIGVFAPGSKHARPSAGPPIDTSGDFPVGGTPRPKNHAPALKVEKKINLKYRVYGIQKNRFSNTVPTKQLVK